MIGSTTPPYEFLGDAEDTTVGTQMRLYAVRQHGFQSYLDLKIQVLSELSSCVPRPQSMTSYLFVSFLSHMDDTEVWSGCA